MSFCWSGRGLEIRSAPSGSGRPPAGPPSGGNTRKGKLPPRPCSPSSHGAFVASRPLAIHHRTTWGWSAASPERRGDQVRVSARAPVAVASQVRRVRGRSAMPKSTGSDLATDTGMFIWSASTARVAERGEACGCNDYIFVHHPRAVVQSATMAEPCAGGAVYSRDRRCLVMVARTSHVFITGPGHQVDRRGRSLRGTRRRDDARQPVGVASFDQDEEVLAVVGHLLSYLPSNNTWRTPSARSSATRAPAGLAAHLVDS